MHGLIFELKKRMNSRQDQPVITTVFNIILIKILYYNTFYLKYYLNLINLIICYYIIYNFNINIC